MLSPFRTEDLHRAVAAVCPIESVAINDGAVAGIGYAPDATPDQRAAAQAVAAAFDLSDAAQAVRDAARQQQAQMARVASPEFLAAVRVALQLAGVATIPDETALKAALQGALAKAPL